MSPTPPRNKRIRTHLPLKWRATFESVIHNISLGGLFYKCSVPPKVGEAIELDFTLPGQKQPIAVSGVVRWISSHSWSIDNENLAGVGVEFVDLSETAQSALQAYIDTKPHGARTGNRVALRLLVDYYFAGENYRTIANEISKHGMFIVSDEPHQLDDTLHVRFTLPNVQALIKARAVVRWRHTTIPAQLNHIITPGMGIEFTDISEEDQSALAHFIETYPES